MIKLGVRGPQLDSDALRWQPLCLGGWRVREAKPSGERSRVRGSKEDREREKAEEERREQRSSREAQTHKAAAAPRHREEACRGVSIRSLSP